MGKVQGSLDQPNVGRIMREEGLEAPAVKKGDDLLLGRFLKDGEASLTPGMKRLISVGPTRSLSITARKS